MPTYTVYRLIFKTQLHLGRTSGPRTRGEPRFRKNRNLYFRRYPLFGDLPDMGNLLRHG